MPCILFDQDLARQRGYRPVLNCIPSLPTSSDTLGAGLDSLLLSRAKN